MGYGVVLVVGGSRGAGKAAQGEPAAVRSGRMAWADGMAQVLTVKADLMGL